MWKMIGIVIITILITLYELPKLIKGKQKKEIVVFLSILLIAVSLSIGKIHGAKIPNPLTGIQVIYGPLGTMVNQLLGQ